MIQYQPINLVMGPYGSGKTTFAVSLALEIAKREKNVTLVDFDTVNPYFRSHDYKSWLEDNNIQLISTNFAGTNLDIPSISGGLVSCLQDIERYIVIDMGGDDVGAKPIGGYAEFIRSRPHMAFVLFNQYRLIPDYLEQVHQIERESRLNITHFVNNSNLGEETTWQEIENSILPAKEMAKQLGITFWGTTAMPSFQQHNIFPLVKHPFLW